MELSVKERIQLLEEALFDVLEFTTIEEMIRNGLTEERAIEIKKLL